MDIETIKTEYEPRILAVLEKIRETVQSHGFQAEPPFEMTDEEYSWCLVIEGNGLKEPVDVQFTILEEAVREGEGPGVAFGIDITSHGGEILGGLCPGNYSPGLWLTDPCAIEDRFWLFEFADPSDICDLLNEAKRQV